MNLLTRWFILVGFLLIHCYGGGVLLRTSSGAPCDCRGVLQPTASSDTGPSCCASASTQHESQCAASSACSCSAASSASEHACYCGCSEAPSETPAAPVVEGLRLLAVRSAPLPIVTLPAVPRLAATPKPMLSRSLIGRDGIDTQAYLSVWRT